MSAIEPRHDAPPCKCGGPLQPSAYADGMLRPELPAPWTGGDGSHCELSMLRCAACGDEIQGAQTQVLLAWFSVGAYEQHLVDEVEIAELKAEVEVQSRENTRLRERLAGQGLLDLGDTTSPADHLYACARMDEPYNIIDTMRHLADATQHLLADHDCDSHGYEQFITAEQSARDMLALWEKS